MGFIIFLYNCIDYSGIFDIDDYDESLSDYVDFRKFFHLHWILWLLMVVYFIYIFCKIIGIIDQLNMYKKISNYYKNVLCIPKWRLKTMGEEIVQYFMNTIIMII